MKGLDGRFVLVTGAAEGIGEATCRALSSYGCRVIGVDRNSSIFGLKKQGILSHAVCLDLSVEDAVSVLVHKVKETPAANHLWGLVNIPCTAVFKTLDAGAADWELAMRSSVVSYSAIVSALRGCFSVEGGAIVNMGSISAHIAQRGYGTYSASKAAVIAYSRCLALELAQQKIRVNTISPGTIWTANNARHIFNDFGLDRQAADADARFGGLVPLRRCGDPHDAGEAIAFLLSDSAAFMTGHDLVVDGGYTLV